MFKKTTNNYSYIGIGIGIGRYENFDIGILSVSADKEKGIIGPISVLADMKKSLLVVHWQGMCIFSKIQNLNSTNKFLK